MRRADSLEKTLMLGKIEGRRIRQEHVEPLCGLLSKCEDLHQLE